MKKLLITVVFVGLLSWVVYDFVIKDDAVSTDSDDFISMDEAKAEDVIGIEAGNIAPDFELTTLDGEVVKLSDYRGQRVMLNFWATWCPPCRAEMPDMQKFHEDKDVVILAVNLTDSESSVDNIPKFVDEFGLTFQIPLDTEVEVAGLYKIQPIPTSFMIDSSGKIKNKAMGALSYELMVEQFDKMK